MLALQITSLKLLMNQLLAGDTFDLFLLEEAVISTANTCQAPLSMEFSRQEYWSG